MYGQRQQGTLARIDMVTGEVVDVQPQPRDGEVYERFNWDSPILVSPHKPSRLYFASQRVWKSDNRGDSWEPISDDLTRNQNRFDLPIMGSKQSWDNPWDVGAMSNYNTVSALSEGLISAFQSVLPSVVSGSALYVGLSLAGVGLLVWGGVKLYQHFSSHGSLDFVSKGSSSVSSHPFAKYCEKIAFRPFMNLCSKDKTSWHSVDYGGYFISSTGELMLKAKDIGYHDGAYVFRHCSFVPYISSDGGALAVRYSNFEDSVRSLPKPDYFFIDASQAESTLSGSLYVVDVPLSSGSDSDSVSLDTPLNYIGSVSSGNTTVKYFKTEDGTWVGVGQNDQLVLKIYPDGTVEDFTNTDTDAQNPADTALTDSSSTDTDAQNPADTAVTDSSPATTDAQNPADTDAAADNPTDVIVKNPADIAKAIDDVASKSVPTANSTALPDAPVFDTTVDTPEVPDVLGKFKSIASSLKLTDKVTTSFSGSCSISGSLDLWGNSVSYNIDFCPYAPYLEQAGDILVMVSGFAALLIMFGL
jgi:hypothetical protein